MEEKKLVGYECFGCGTFVLLEDKKKGCFECGVYMLRPVHKSPEELAEFEVWLKSNEEFLRFPDPDYEPPEELNEIEAWLLSHSWVPRELKQAIIENREVPEEMLASCGVETEGESE